jgi:hypothetical protein
MSSMRRTRPDQMTLYAVVDAQGNVVSIEANKAAASRLRNKLEKEGKDVTGWTLQARPRQA